MGNKKISPPHLFWLFIAEIDGKVIDCWQLELICFFVCI